jgi:cardiolipin synthase
MIPVKRVGLIVVALVVVVLALIGILSVTRGTPVHSVVVLGRSGLPPAMTDSMFAATIELHAKVHIEGGNRVEILNNGDETYPRIWKEIARATRTLTVQMYYAQPGRMADTLASLLVDRARAGVRVLLVLDAFGAQNLDGRWADGLSAAGVEVSWLRPLRWYALDDAGNRSHVRLVIVDGLVAYTGGFGIADYWFGNGRRKNEWRETNVRFEGPTVMHMQAAFAAAWAEATGELLTGDVFFPRQSFAPAGPVRAGLFFATPSTGSTTAERFLALSIASARRTLYITNSYFVPDDDFRRMLREAAARGVDVRILTAGDETDIKTTTYAARARYGELLRGGVRIWEYLPTMMHSKSFVVDGVWWTVGSLNFDNRSLAFNDEANLVGVDSAIAARLTADFMEDLEYSREITLEEFSRRPWTRRFLEWGANLVSRVL